MENLTLKLELGMDNKNRVTHTQFTSFPHLIAQPQNGRLPTSSTGTMTTTLYAILKNKMI
ncbi:MAG: hypothetical protein HPY74_06815 [Firmicutes bacterium]|nr:hypothetical protein [Bacillota bacterium]